MQTRCSQIKAHFKCKQAEPLFDFMIFMDYWCHQLKTGSYLSRVFKNVFSWWHIDHVETVMKPSVSWRIGPVLTSLPCSSVWAGDKHRHTFSFHVRLLIYQQLSHLGAAQDLSTWRAACCEAIGRVAGGLSVCVCVNVGRGSNSWTAACGKDSHTHVASHKHTHWPIWQRAR